MMGLEMDMVISSSKSEGLDCEQSPLGYVEAALSASKYERRLMKEQG